MLKFLIFEFSILLFGKKILYNTEYRYIWFQSSCFNNFMHNLSNIKRFFVVNEKKNKKRNKNKYPIFTTYLLQFYRTLYNYTCNILWLLLLQNVWSETNQQNVCGSKSIPIVYWGTPLGIRIKHNVKRVAKYRRESKRSPPHSTLNYTLFKTHFVRR